MSEEEPSGPARARARQAPPPLEREAYIRDLMVRLQYQRGRTPAELAGRWGLSVDTVVNDASRASATLALPEDDIPGAQERMLFTVRGLLDAFDEAIRAGDWGAIRALGPNLEVARKVLKLKTPDAAASVNVQIANLFDETGRLNDAGRAAALEDVRPGIAAIVEAAVAHLPERERDAEATRLYAIGQEAMRVRRLPEGSGER